MKNPIMEQVNDLVLLVGPDAENFEASSSFLTEESEWFTSIISGRWTLKTSQDGKRIIRLPEDDPEDFRLFLKLLKRFDGKELKLVEDEDFKTVAAVQELAERYQVAKLKKNLADWYFLEVKKRVTPVTLISFYSMAKGVKNLQEVVCRFVAENINKFWKSTQWLDLDESAIKLILSNDKTHHKGAYKVYMDWEVPCEVNKHNLGDMDRYCSEKNAEAEKRCVSRNELLILAKALEWMDHRKLKTCDLNESEERELPMRLFKHIRFTQMSDGDLVEALRQAQEKLTTLQMGEIIELKLNRNTDKATVSTDPDNLPRILPAPQRKQAVCKYKLCWNVTAFQLASEKGQEQTHDESDEEADVELEEEADAETDEESCGKGDQETYVYNCCECENELY